MSWNNIIPAAMLGPDVEARLLYERSSAGYKAPSWGALTEPQKDMYRDWVRRTQEQKEKDERAKDSKCDTEGS